MNARDAFKKLYREARMVANRLSRDDEARKAYWVVDRALNNLVQVWEDDWRVYLDGRSLKGQAEGAIMRASSVEHAVLFAWHWMHGRTTLEIPLWGSERRIGFELREDGSRMWFVPPRLPG